MRIKRPKEHLIEECDAEVVDYIYSLERHYLNSEGKYFKAVKPILHVKMPVDDYLLYKDVFDNAIKEIKDIVGHEYHVIGTSDNLTFDLP